MSVADLLGACQGSRKVCLMSKNHQPPSSNAGPSKAQLWRAIDTLLGNQPIAYHAPIAKVLGSVTAAVFFSQLYFWSKRTKNPAGWLWKTHAEMYDETGLTRR